MLNELGRLRQGVRRCTLAHHPPAMRFSAFHQGSGVLSCHSSLCRRHCSVLLFAAPSLLHEYCIIFLPWEILSPVNEPVLDTGMTSIASNGPGMTTRTLCLHFHGKNDGLMPPPSHRTLRHSLLYLWKAQVLIRVAVRSSSGSLRRNGSTKLVLIPKL